MAIEGMDGTKESQIPIKDRVKIAPDLDMVPGYRCEACGNVVWALVCPCGGMTDGAVTVLSEMEELPVGGRG